MLDLGQTVERKYNQFELLYHFHSLGRETHYRKQKAMYLALRKRVFQASLNHFLVESKRYLPTLGKPSRFHIVRQRRPGPLHFWCDCKHSGVHTSPFDYCSHVLAVIYALSLKAMSPHLLLEREGLMLKTEDFASKVLLQYERLEGALCMRCEKRTTLNRVPLVQDLQYQCGHCGAVFDKTKLHKLIVFNQMYAGIPTTGNEYMDHVKAKKRIFDLLANTRGFKNIEYEYLAHCRDPFTGFMRKYPYVLDVFAEYKPLDDKIIPIGIEVHGKKGHGTRITIPQDDNRAAEIEEQLGIKVIQFYIDSQLTDIEDSYILEEIYRKIGV